MPELLYEPREGLPPLCTTVEEIASAARLLESGVGPFAIDTERASGFRYDDRAFLLQIRRRQAGTVLIDPSVHPEAVTQYLGKAINSHTWIIHAAPSDLPCLRELGLRPSNIFDTELAGRLMGMPRVNLAAMSEEIVGLTLLKGHGAEDWSRRPLPIDWLNYAALDVETLLDLADAMAELLDSQGKLEWAEQEFEHLVRMEYENPRQPKQWVDIKGIGSINDPEQLIVAREIWNAREKEACETDKAASRLLPDKAIVGLALSMPQSVRAVERSPGYPSRLRKAARKWLGIVRAARELPPSQRPQRNPRPPRPYPAKSLWGRDYPEVLAVWDDVQSSLNSLSLQLEIPIENILQPAALREIVWLCCTTYSITSHDDLVQALKDHQVREWQIQIVLEPLHRKLL
ncbi:HRDC domain-containing protein [Corynebacterium pseudotuberculosis]|uniref:HRDC domain-containing protein n=1 Tax=Corynebacterium pseudotuberculosis TaxID=1719 RepID=UPI0007191A7B|nr:HRDC domain-containing protein [Corynebacterium pseudotuberculosis]ALP33869.1 Ribonuclease D [Corynebacterium pseudotuberculosis]ALR33811.1 Ribonuclease D [Corynebacterium pseudotuberculosis]APX36235.1 ribonuclease D [Corynebacterium pseudotuberculosis]APX37984.1 ribonuclease D [Corynebacterium pseudotuberculosis]AQL51316.1 Ribonuclease D [Corynebacterium pseudotuberculosis]